MARKELILFDPITCEKKVVTYKYVCELANMKRPNVVSCYSQKRKVTKINCYLLDLDTPNSVLSSLLEKEIIKDEVWRRIQGTCKRQWEVSSYGRYRYRYTENSAWKYHVLTVDRDGYTSIQITLNGKCQKLRSQKLVAEYFLGPRPSKNHCIRKWSQNPFNNTVSNLYYGLTKDMLRSTSKNRSGPIFKIDPSTGKIIDEYESITEAAKHNYTAKSNIREALKSVNNRVSAIGYIWMEEKNYNGEYGYEYENEYEEIELSEQSIRRETGS